MRLGVPLPMSILDFVAGRCRRNTVLATAYDLRIFFAVVGKDPAECPTLMCSASSPRSLMVVTAGCSSPMMAGV